MRFCGLCREERGGEAGSQSLAPAPEPSTKQMRGAVEGHSNKQIDKSKIPVAAAPAVVVVCFLLKNSAPISIFE